MKVANRHVVVLRKADGVPKQSWWLQIDRKAFSSAAKLAAERMKQSHFGNVETPITASK